MYGQETHQRRENIVVIAPMAAGRATFTSHRAIVAATICVGCPPNGATKSRAIEPRTPHSAKANDGITDTKQYISAIELKASVVAKSTPAD